MKEIDWEQRRYEIAKDMLSVMYIDEGQEISDQVAVNECIADHVAGSVKNEIKKG